MCVCNHVDGTTAQRLCMCDWVCVSVMNACLSSVNTSACVCGWMCQSSGYETAGWPPGCCWGWMDECEHLFNAPFTAIGLIHLSEMPLSFHLSDVHSNHSHWWITLSPLPSLTLSVWCRVVISENVTPAVCVGAWEPPRCINVHLSTWVDIQLLLQLCSSLRQVVFFKNKCRKTSAEMWPHAALAHHKWFPSAGGYLLALVTRCFLPQTTS